MSIEECKIDNIEFQLVLHISYKPPAEGILPVPPAGVERRCYASYAATSGFPAAKSAAAQFRRGLTVLP